MQHALPPALTPATRTDVAKKSIVEKWKREARSSRSASLQPVPPVRPAAGRTCAISGCAASASGSWPCWADSGRRQGELVSPMNVSNPIANPLTRSATPAGRATRRCIPRIPNEAGDRPILKGEGYIDNFSESHSRHESRRCASISSTSSRCPSCRASSESASRGCGSTRAKTQFPRVQGGLGMVIISTRQGIRTGEEAARGSSASTYPGRIWSGRDVTYRPSSDRHSRRRPG